MIEENNFEVTEEDLISRVKLAISQDRERFFRVADSIHLQPKYAEHLEELEIIKQQWRDIPQLKNYPYIAFPLELPLWFPQVKMFSRFTETYIQDTLVELGYFE